MTTDLKRSLLANVSAVLFHNEPGGVFDFGEEARLAGLLQSLAVGGHPTKILKIEKCHNMKAETLSGIDE